MGLGEGHLGGFAMRLVSLSIALLVVPALALVNAEDGKSDVKPLRPEAAAKKIDEKCTVQMEVKSTGMGKGVLFLNSKENYKDVDNFTVFINKAGVEKLKEAKIFEPADHYKNKTILVTGTVKLYRDKPQIVIEKADQIRVLEKKTK
jgi:DNA/RNA endonuclease YhcR with UshA esterase domain